MSKMLNIMEYFYSIQGEGSRAGKPSVFIRLSGCNFTCAGFGVQYETPEGQKKVGCDSFYSVDTKFKDRWNKYVWTDLVTRVEEIIPQSNTNKKVDIVITGGEPLIWWNNKDFQNMISYYVSRGHKVTIETNASIGINFTKEYQKEILFSMSVKLSNSGETKARRIKIPNISGIIQNCPSSYLKFVVDKDSKDVILEEIEEILSLIPHYATVYLMPMGDTIETLSYNAEEVINICMEKKFNYSDRLHIRIWNNKEGV